MVELTAIQASGRPGSPAVRNTGTHGFSATEVRACRRAGWAGHLARAPRDRTWKRPRQRGGDQGRHAPNGKITARC